MLAEILAKLVACHTVLSSIAVSVNEDSSFESSVRSADGAFRSERSSGESFESGGFNLESMASAFSRSEKVHLESMASISRSLSMFKAVDIMRKTHKVTPAVLQIANLALGKGQLQKPQPGYAGVDSAKTLLNDMIFQSMSKYDGEIAKCVEFYSEHCAAMEQCRGQISGANFLAANSRALMLDSQANIHRCQEEIPSKKYELKQHMLKCESELQKLHERLKIVSGDIAVMTMILEMTDCDKSFAQANRLSLLHCQDPCTKKTFVQFNHAELQEKVNELKSSFSQDLMTDTFKDLFEGIESLESYTLLQTESQQLPTINKTEFNNPPVPMTKVPPNPCNDPFEGAPSKHDKRAAKCTLGPSPKCYKLQERFLLIQAGINDERDEILEEISMLEQFCEETKKTIETQIDNDEALLESSQTKLAESTEKEATAAETARTTAGVFDRLNQDLIRQMRTCSANYINFETEICALKKIRGELYKLKGTLTHAFFQDCEVSKWDPEECTKKCGSGEQKLTRSVLTHPDGGAKCLPLAAMKSCNNNPCPVDCQLSGWGGWSKCSAQCGGGVTQRLREVKVAMKYGGHPCGPTSDVRPCNTESCEKNCELTDWTKWTHCSKDCDGGTQKRTKFIKTVAEGQGKCPDEWNIKRLQYKHCNMDRCETASASEPLTCNTTLDVVLLLDGSGSLGKEGWEAEIHAAKLFTGAFGPAEGRVNVAVILFSGPRTWGGVSKCMGKNDASVSLDYCGIKVVQHFTNDLTQTTQALSGLTWPQGSTLTSLALMTAKAELALGRGDVRSLVVVITDGRPLSYRKTKMASREIRKLSRLIWVPVTRFAPLKHIKDWATRRWQENVVKVEDFTELRSPDIITHIIADICPKEQSHLRFGRAGENELLRARSMR